MENTVEKIIEHSPLSPHGRIHFCRKIGMIRKSGNLARHRALENAPSQDEPPMSDKYVRRVQARPRRERLVVGDERGEEAFGAAVGEKRGEPERPSPPPIYEFRITHSELRQQA
jgi:hypothetical protein